MKKNSLQIFASCIALTSAKRNTGSRKISGLISVLFAAGMLLCNTQGSAQNVTIAADNSAAVKGAAVPSKSPVAKHRKTARQNKAARPTGKFINTNPATANVAAQFDSPTYTTSQPSVGATDHLHEEIQQELKKEDKITLDLFVMSQCPFGVMGEQAMTNLIKEFGDKIELRLNFIADEQLENGKTVFNSMHGQSEVEEDIRQLVIARDHPGKLITYLAFRAENYQNENWQIAADKSGIDVHELTVSVANPESEKLLSENIKHAKALGIGGSPTLVINNVRFRGQIFEPSAFSTGTIADPSGHLYHPLTPIGTTALSTGATFDPGSLTFRPARDPFTPTLIGSPSPCTTGTDPFSGSNYVVCTSTPIHAWISANTGGSYHPLIICNSLGYATVGSYGGTCGNVCGYCTSGTSCSSPGAMHFDGGGNGFDVHGQVLGFTVQWECNGALTSFNNGSPQNSIFCRNSVSNDINSLLTASGLTGLTFTWTVTSPPVHGTLSGFPATAASGTNISPSGLTYTPNSGYTGADPFTIQLSDGTLTASTTINVTVGPPTITNVSPAIASPLTTITITGTGFNTTMANDVVFFGATKGSVTAAAPTLLTVTAPTDATFSDVTVDNLGCNAIGYSQKPFLPTYSGVPGYVNFNTKVDFAAGSNSRSVAIGDLDGDGRSDVAVVNQTAGTISVYLNTSTSGTIVPGSFTLFTTISTPGAAAQFVTFGDIDGDGKLDMLVANGGANTVSVFRNTSGVGTISFAGAVTLTTASTPFGIVIGDMDGDGRPDVAVANVNSANISVFQNTGSVGTIAFAAQVNYAAGSFPYIMAIGDIDGDGQPDLIAVNQGSNNISVYRNISGSGTINFSPQFNYTTGSSPESVTIGDIDGDGKLDVVVANQGSNNVSVFLNTATSGVINAGTFATPATFGTGSGPQSVAIGDIDGDNKPDVVVSNYTGSSVSILRSTSIVGTINFAAKADFIVGTNPWSVAVGDLDGDGRADVATANIGSANFSVLRFKVNTAPTFTGGSPQSLTVCQSSGATDIKPLLHVSDVDAGQTETWSQSVAPTHGTLSFTSATASSGTTNITPGGTITYTPTVGYSGTDAFTVQVSDGIATATTIINVTVNPLPVFTLTAGGPTTFCNGGSVVIYAGGTTGFLNSPSGSGSTTRCDCPTGYVAVGYSGRSGTWMDQFSIQCRQLNNGVISGGAIATTSNGISGGGSAAGPFLFGGNTLMVGADMRTGSGHLSGMQGFGQLASYIAAQGNNSSSPSSLPLMGPGGSSLGTIFVPNGNVITGMYAYNNFFADGVAFNYTPVWAYNTGGILWSNSATTPSITVSSSGSYTATITDNNSCSYTPAAIPVTVNPRPVPSFTSAPSANTCAGISVTYTTQTGGGISNYIWGGFGTPTDYTIISGGIGTGSNTVTVKWLTTGSKTVTVNYSDVNLCTGVSPASSTTIVNPLPTPTFTAQPGANACATTNVTYTTQTGGGITSYIWGVPGTLGTDYTIISGGTGTGSNTVTLQWLTAGSKTVTINYTDGHGCTAASPTSSTPTTIQMPPVVTSVSPLIGFPAAPVTITGTGFNTTMLNDVVYFGATRATVSAATTTSLSVTAPIGATYMPVTVDNISCALTGYSQKPFLQDYNNAAFAAGTVNFDPRIDLSTGNFPDAVTMGDIDGDGKDDIAVANRNDGTISVYMNTGSIGSVSFAGPITLGVGSVPFRLKIADIDGDGKLDIVVPNRSSNTLTLFRNTSTVGSISFAPAVTLLLTSNGPGAVAVGDIDGDGKADLIVSNQFSNNVSVIRNTGTAGTFSFAAQVDFSTPSTPYGVNVADIDGDGKVDIGVANNSGANNISLFRNTSAPGTITMAARQDFPTHLAPGFVGFADLDGDGKTDVISTNVGGNDMSVFRNLSSPGTIVLGVRADIATNGSPQEFSAGDFDGDGKVDIAVTNTGSSNISVFRNTSTVGTILFAAKVDFTALSAPSGIGVGDLDGDGKADIAMANQFSNKLSIFRNDPLQPITGPSSVCYGGVLLNPITLSDATPNGTWSSSNPAVATVGALTGIVTGVSAGTVTITYAGTAGTSFTGNIVIKTITVNPMVNIIGPSQVCPGAVITVSDPAPGGAWSSTNIGLATVGSGTGVITGIAAGFPTISYTVPSTGCAAAFVLTVNPLPALIGGLLSYCPGTTGTLTDVSLGGTWNSGTPGVATIDPATGFVNAIATGMDIISYTLPTTCSTTTVINVYSTPFPIAGTMTVCVGSTTTLADATPFGTWSSGSPLIATVNATTGVVTGVGAGTATITYSLGTGCIATAIVTVNAAPVIGAITGSAMVCTGSTTPLGDGTGGGTWTSSNPALATVGTSSGTVSGISVGSVTITYTVTSGGCTGFVTKPMTINPTPSAITGTASVCVSSTTLLSDAGGGTWTSGTPGNATIGSSTGLVTGIAPGTTLITYTLPTGCIATKTVSVNPLPAAINFLVTNTLSYTGSVQTWTVPAGVTSIQVDAQGAQGGNATGSSDITTPGKGGRVQATLAVTPGQVLNIYVGGGGLTGDPSFGVAGGFNGGGAAAAWGGPWGGGSGGGATDIRIGGTALTNRLIVAGGGGGGGLDGSCSVDDQPGGDGGGLIGAGVNTCVSTILSFGFSLTLASGGNQSSGGNGTALTPGYTPGDPGSLGNGGASNGGGGISGGGGGGYYGGGGGSWTGGAGGSSYTDPVLATSVTHTQGFNAAGNGIVTITYSVPPTVCVGLTIPLTDPTPLGAWSSSNTAEATIGTTGIVTGVAAGTPTISYTLPTGCYATAQITVNPLPAAITGGLVVCVGNSTTLADATTGGTWTSSAPAVATIGSSTGFVSALTAGTTVITYTLPTGCTVTTTVTVNPLPATITGTFNVCVGANTTLSSAPGGGTWTSSNTGEATVAGGTVTGVAAGTPTITYTLGTGCFVTQQVTVNPVPLAITGTATVCAGGFTNLNDATTGGTWTSSVPTTATIGSTTGIVSGLVAGTTVITYTLPAGCFITRTVTVNPLPAVITGTVNVCVGLTRTLNDLSGPSTWSSSNTGVATVGAGTGVVSGISAGTATITFTIPATGCYTTTPFTVNPLPAAITGNTPVCAGSTIVLSDVTTGGTWSSASPLVGTIDPVSGIFSAAGSGTSLVTYTLATGCISTATVTVNPLPSLISGAPAVCVGLTTTYTDLSGTSTWSSGNTGVATIGATGGLVTGVSAGTATITFTLPTGCIATKPITVNPLPLAITGTASVCTGLTTVLADATTGGTWTSGSLAIATVGSITGVVSGLTPGTSTITYTLPTGCLTTTTVTVNTNPSTITGTLNVCVGLTTTLNSTPAGGTWTSSDIAMATVSGSVVTGVSAGTPIITYTLGTGCFTTMMITVNALPSAITGTAVVCTGTSVTLGSTPSGGSWSSSNTLQATAGTFTGVVTGVSPGNPVITYTLPTGCTATKTATVNGTPTTITGTLNVCVGNTTALGSTPAGGTWSSSNTLEATVGTAGAVTGISAGMPTISYTLGTGCFNTAIVTVNATPAAISGSAAVCVGFATTLGDATTGGTWTSSIPTVASVGPTTGIVSGLLTGTTQITYALPTGCSASIIVTVNPNPPAITGTGAVCPGSTLPLFDGIALGTWTSSNIAEATVGSSSGIVTGVAAGTPFITYTLGTGCYTAATVTVNPAPNTTVFSLPLATSQCVGLSSTVTVASSSLGAGTFTVTYNLSGANTSTANTATLSMGVSSGTFTIPSTLLTLTGSTTVTITSLTNTLGCSTNLVAGNTAIFTVQPLPAVFNVTGGGGYCTGGSGVHIGLSGSNTGINYQLMLGVTAIGAPVAGTSSPLDFGLFTTAGTYSVVATNSTTGCVNNMSGTVTVTVNVLPTAFGVTGGGSYCAGGIGLAIGLSGSQGSVNYQLFNGSTAVGSPVGGTGGVITFGLQTAAGTYSVVATNTVTGCTNAMTGTATIVINPLPSAITGTLSACPGTTTILGDATTGGTWTSSLPGTATVGSATGIVTAVIAGNTNIIYTLPTGCNTSVAVTINPLPSGITGTFSVCTGATTSLNDITPGGSWSSSNTFQATVGTTGIVTGVNAGTPSIIYTLPTGCLASVAVTVNTTPAAISGSATVCAGLTTPLLDATTGGTWSSSDITRATVGSTTGVVSGVLAGTANIIYTLPGGCTAVLAMTVNPSPAVITGVTTVCVGATTALNDGVTGGSWSSSNTAEATVGSTGIVTGAGAGTPVITYTLPAGCFITTTVTVNATPVAITGTASVCVGLTTTLGDATSGGTWSSSDITKATVGSTTGIVTGVNVGIPNIIYTLPGGCTATLPVTVNALPSGITGITSVCPGFTTTLNDASIGGTWSSGDPLLATVAPSTGVVSGIAAGMPAITYTLSTGCIATTIVTVNPLPAAITGITNVCTGLSITLADATTGGTWSSSNTAIATAATTTGVVTGVSAGTVTITYTLPTGCFATVTITVNASPVAISGSNIVCLGLTTTLSEGTIGGNWTSSNPSLATVGSGSGIVTGVAIGSPVISYILPTGCQATMTVTVVPTPAAITGTGTVCVGSTTLLLDATSGGTWSSSDITKAGVGSGTGVVTGIGAGTANITYTLPGGCTAITTITVNPLPAAISGSATVCVASTTTLNDGTTGGSWTSSNTAVATIGSATGTVTGVSAGSVILTYTLPTGCLGTFSLTVNPLPAAIAGSSTVCVTATSALTDITTGGSWSSTNTAVATIGSTTGTITGISAGSTVFSYTLPTGCAATAAGVVNALPSLFTVTGGGSYCTGGVGVHIGLSGSATGINYQLKNGSLLVGSPLAGTGAALDFGLQTAPGTYTVVATNTVTGCFVTMSGTAVVTGNPLPTVFAMTGGGGYCSGGTGLHIGLSGSTNTVVSYQLFNGIAPVGSPLTGTGSSLDFGLQTAAGTYTVVATNTTTGCVNNMSGSAVITINPLPTAWSVTGGGPYCTGGAGVHIGLSGSVIGINYQLFNGVTAVGSPVTGTGSAIDFGLFTATGTYTVVGTNPTTGCVANMAGSVTVSITALPTAFTVSGGGSYCSGGAGFHINLSNSTTGVNYQLLNGVVAVGAPVAGTGAGLDFGLQTVAGTYTVLATSATTGCSATMSGSATITVNPLPLLFSITGGGSYCSGGTGLAIGLSGSQSGVNYQLFAGITAIGGAVAGTGSAISFGIQTTAGIYTVVATNPTTTCTATMSGSVVIAISPLPTLYTVTGGGSYCPGGSGVIVNLNGSDVGVSYQLKLAGSPVGSPVAGTGTAISFGLQTGAGAYTVFATNTSTGCTATMSGSVTVSISILPTAFSVTGGGGYCSGGSGAVVGLGNSQSGVNYQLFVGTTPVGSPVAGTGSAISFGLQTAAGVYTVVATSTVTGCSNTMSGSVTITINPLPTVYSMTGGGSICAGGTGVAVGLSGSQVGVSYQLYNSGVLSGGAVLGTGSAISFGILTAAGTYTVVATNTVTFCPNNMSGSAVISINPRPTAYTVTGGGSYCSGGSGVHVGLGGSDAGVNYQLYLGLSTVGSPLAGTGAALDFGAQAASGIYTIVATNTSTSCTNNMSGSVTVTINALPTTYTVTGGGSYCSGGTIPHIGLSGSNIGISYQLYLSGIPTGSAVAGTGVGLDFGPEALAGTYTVTATNTVTGCTNTMSGSVTVSINALPTVYIVTGGGAYCSGGSGVSIGLVGSDIGINYQLYRGITAIGGPVAGSGGALSFGLQTVAGTYTVTATNPGTTCSSNMSGSVTVTVNPLPTTYTVTGGGGYCTGGAGVHIGLSNSQSGTSYQLYRGVTATGAPVAGSGVALDFGIQSVAGSYSVVATNTVTGCSATMSGTVTVSVNPLPVVYNVTGGGSFCSGGAGVHVFVSNSQSGVNYQLFRGVTGLGIVPGTGVSLDFGLQTVTGTYTVVATNPTTTCGANMSGSATVSVNALPAIYTVTGGGGYCSGGTGVLVGLGGSQTGVNYQLFRGVTGLGILGGTGSSLNFGLQTVAGTYTVVATNTTTTCTNNMSGSAAVTINPLPVAYSVTGGGAYCSGGTGVHINLSGSAVGVNYQLYRGVTAVGSPVAGTGSILDFGLQTVVGTYTVVATDATTGCSATMSGSTTVSVTTAPLIYSMTGGGSTCATGTGVAVGLSGSQSGVNYQLYRGVIPVGSPVAGTGSAISFGLQTTGGSYTAVGTATTGGCSSNMSGSAVVTINPSPTVYSVTGGGAYCAGGIGYHVGLSGSQSGVNYQLYRGASPVGSAVAGSGAALDFGLQTTGGGYTVVATNVSSGCIASMSGSATITVYALPGIYSVTGGGSYCVGGFGMHVGLSGSATGIHYQLYRGIVAVGSPVNGTGAALDFGLQTASGTYTVVATSITTTCTANMSGSVAISITLLPTVTAISGLSTVAVGSHITLTDATTGGVWSSSNTAIATTGSSSGIVTGVTAGAVTIRYTVSNSCGSAVATYAVTVTPPGGGKSVNPSTGVCVGSVITLVSKDQGGVWSSSDHGIATVGEQSGVVSGIAAGTATINYMVISGTDTSIVSTPVQVYGQALPVVISADPGVNIGAGETVTLSAKVTGAGPAVTYQWLVNTASIPGATMARYTSSSFVNEDVVSCHVSGVCGDIPPGNKVVITVSNAGTGLVVMQGGEIRVVPNPNKGMFTVRGTLDEATDADVSLEITDVLGQVIYTGKVIAHNGVLDQKIQLPGSVANGMYLLNLHSGNENKVFHIVIEQ